MGKRTTYREEVISKLILKIKNKRQLKGLSHENMSTDLGISPSAYNKIERQETKLSLERLLQIQQILDLSYSEVFDIKSENIFNQDIKDNGIGHQEIQNLYQESKEVHEKHIESLKKEIDFLHSIIKKP